MILYGAGGHAKVIIEILEKLSVPITQIYDDSSQVTKILNYPVQLWRSPPIDASEEIFLSIGDNKVRLEKYQTLKDLNFPSIVSKKSLLSSKVEIDRGTIIMDGVIIHSSTTIGKHCIVNTSSVVEHDCFLDNFTHIAPNATICGHCSIGEGTLVGAAAVIIPGVKVGRWVKIGAGSVVLEDIKDYAIVAGNPARSIKKE